MSVVVDLPGAGKRRISGRPATQLQEALAARILRLLKDRQAAPGYRVNVADLSRHFKVSSPRIRAALRLLTAHGMTSWRTQKGFVLDRPVAGAWSVIPGALQKRPCAHAVVGARASGVLARICSTREVARAIDARPSAALAAMDELAALGLVQKRYGAKWRFPDDEQFSSALEESYRFRLAIETCVLTQIGPARAIKFLAEMKARHHALLHASGDVVEAFRALNCAFHHGLMQLAGNKFAVASVRQQLEIADIVFSRGDPATIRASLREHLAVIDALERGTPMMAASLMRDHLLASRHRREPAVPERDCHD